MNPADSALQDNLLNDIPDQLGEAEEATAASDVRPRRDFSQMMRRIPVTLTLEVGSARISLQDLAALQQNSVIELDTLAGQPLVIKVNGTPIGRAEVVVSGENYGLKVVELSDLDLESLK
jgi:flagellar motor switch protein FliN/FliY